MSAFTVEKVVGQEQWRGREGQGMVTYELLLTDSGRTVNLIKQATSPAPSAGDVLEGHLEGDKLKLARQNGAQAGSRSSTGGGKTYDRQPDHPVQMQRALHTSAISTALPLIEQMFTFGLTDVPKPTTKDEYLKLVEGVATWVQQSYPQAVLDQAAKADVE